MKRRLLAILLCGMLAVMFTACGDKDVDGGSEDTSVDTQTEEVVEEEPAEEPVEETDEAEEEAEDIDVDAQLQGEWMADEASGFSFHDGAVYLGQDGEEQLSGEYTINEADSTIDCTLHASDGDLSVSLPYKVEDGAFHLYKNGDGDEMTRR